MEYKIQLIHFNGKKTHRILQNVGGPCPLLGLCNALLLNNDIRVNQNISSIKFKDLTRCLKDHLTKLFEVNMGSKDNINESQMANAIQNIEDCVQLFPKLEEGLDINIKFDDVINFEYTSAIAMFDNYNIRLLHGWCIDPQDKQLYTIMHDKSYNEIVDLLTSETDSKLDDVQVAEIEQEKDMIRQFLTDYQQQLTAHGLTRMHEVMNENEIAIFFRNNHFSAIYKRQGCIWELVTDEGIVDADGRITWQSLSQLSGDEQFVSNKFNVISQNDSQQAQIESYNNTLKQQQQQQAQGFSIADQDAYLQKQYDETNKKLTDNDNDSNNKNDKVMDKKCDDAVDNAIAQRIALEQQLGLKSGELEKLEREQREAMQQLEKQQITEQPKYGNVYGNGNGGSNDVLSSNPYNNAHDPYNNPYNNPYNSNNNPYNNQKNNNNVYTHNYDQYANQYQNRKGKRKKKKNGKDDCIVL